MLEKEAADRERKRAEDAYKAAVLARDSRAIELDNLDKECRKKLQLSCCQYNKALVRVIFCWCGSHDDLAFREIVPDTCSSYPQ